MHRPLAVAFLALTLSAPLASKADEAAIEARQSLMTLFSFNLGPMALMAQGRMDYDAETAQTAAANLYHASRHAQDRLWPEGTAQGEFEGSRARPAIWENLEEFASRYSALQDAAANMNEVAGDGLDALQGALGGLAGACRNCHDDFRLTN
jgi:cytochrome c556